MKIKAILIKEDGSTVAKTFNRKSEKQARDVYYDLSVYVNTYAVALCDDKGNVIEMKCRY